MWRIFLFIQSVCFLQIQIAQAQFNESSTIDAVEKITKDLESINPAANNFPVCYDNIGESTLKDYSNTFFPVSVISYEHLFAMFDLISAKDYIPFKYPEEGCYARAHEINRILEVEGIISGKIFVEGRLRVETKNSPKGFVEWKYHVAAVVVARRNGEDVLYVIDPTLFDAPVTVEEWLSVQTGHETNAAKSIYLNDRFHYMPNEKSKIILKSRAIVLEDMRVTLQKHLEIQQRRSRK